jgi:hypothetical protein
LSTVESKERFSAIPRIPRIVPVAFASDRGGRGGVVRGRGAGVRGKEKILCLFSRDVKNVKNACMLISFI